MRTLLLIATLAALAQADVPVHCRHDQIVGHWTLSLGAATGSLDSIQCAKLPESKQNKFSFGPEFGFAGDPNFKLVSTLRVELRSPNVAVAEGVEQHGTWSMLYDQGFEIRVAGRVLFGYSKYKVSKAPVGSTDPKALAHTSMCHLTFPGWFAQGTAEELASPCAVGCWSGVKSEPAVTTQVVAPSYSELEYVPEDQLIHTVNTDPASKWTATHYPQLFQTKTMRQLQRMAGAVTRGLGQQRHELPEELIEAKATQHPDKALPKSLDWRLTPGVVSAPINQGSCGSCYAVSTADALSSRIQIKFKSKSAPVSAQQVLCEGRLSQGCNGGFPVAVLLQGWMGRLSSAGPEYTGSNTCVSRATNKSVGVIRGGYIGGFYGACSEASMMAELAKHGPIVVAFEATAELFHYKQGVFGEHKSKPNQGDGYKTANRWEPTNHAVVAVGWGETAEGLKYWVIKNSWGEDWGEGGYFRIERGTDAYGIESMASSGLPVLGAQHKCDVELAEQRDSWQEIDLS